MIQNSMALGAIVAVVEGDKVLLTQREDFEVWCLPGGHVDPAESVAQTAIREAKEETGLEIELQRLVGIYSRLEHGGNNVHLVLFAATPVGGILQPQVEEVLALKYFDIDDLPDDMVWWHRQPIADVFNGIGDGVARSFVMTPPQSINSREELYALRDESGLTRPNFYRYYFEHSGTDAVSLEVGGS
jgi:8-oxo-dGTP pyrophosphatase MutT (NUDIX family)